MVSATSKRASVKAQTQARARHVSTGSQATPKPNAASAASGLRPPAAAAHPHDGLVKWTFTQLEHACGLLKAVLPPGLSELTDWSTLRVEKSSFVDRTLRSRHSDILFSVRVDAEIARS